MRLYADQYFTDPVDVLAVLPLVADLVRGGGYIVEPSAGTGYVVEALQSVGVAPDRILAFEKDARLVEGASYLPAYVGDTLAVDLPREAVDSGAVSLVIGNPPYNLAEDFVTWGLRNVSPGGSVLYLLRTCFTGSVGRLGLFENHNPDLAFLARRPSFMRKLTEKGKLVTTDVYTYAWFRFYREPYPVRRGNVWVDNRPKSIERRLRDAALPVPDLLYRRYVPVLVDHTGEVLEPPRFV